MFRSFFASIAIAAATALAPVAAEASTLTAGQQRLLSNLDAAGVTVKAGECPTEEAFGWFVPKKQFIAICTNVVDSEESAWETLRHEAVHAAQFCVDPSMESTVLRYSFIRKHRSESDWQFIRSAYHISDWAIESEAFTLMRLSNDDIANLVEKACL